MFNIHKVEKQIGGKLISLETGKIARQANGAVIVRCGETMVLVTAVTAPARNEEIDYFPLSVDYREKYSAAGKFPGGFIKREGRPSTKETLTARMIDRPLRPLFPEGYFNEVQILATVISADQENDPDVLAMIGASAALEISKIPFDGPLGACRISRVDNKLIVFPTHSERDKSDMNLIIGGHIEAVNMIEVDAKQVCEEDIAQAVLEGHEAIKQVCELIAELKGKCGVQKELTLVELAGDFIGKVRSKTADKLRRAFQITQKADRNTEITKIYTELAAEFAAADTTAGEKTSTVMLKSAFEKIQEEIVRELILKGRRPDGRGYDQIRQITCEVGLLPRSHGSSLFTRGQTQALVTVTLGTGRDEQTVDGLIAEYGQKFMLHYNFPPSSVGEVKFIRGPGRREIGHGSLAEKALQQVTPSESDFPYTVKIVSDITESNGSSSMASVCGGCLALMDAGIPIERPVAGISIGMVSKGEKFELLTDIIGDEDHFGDMDFKVAGTEKGITAIQLDLKTRGLPQNVLVQALQKAKTARLEIIKTMTAVIPAPRTQLSTYAPKIVMIRIDPEYIGKVIGPGGKMIKSIQEMTKSVIEIEDDGTICISTVGGNGHIEARDIIEAMTTPPQVGRLYKTSKVVTVKEFGAFVEISPGVEGLCHISELSNEYIKNVDDVCKVGDIIPVKLISIDDQGRLKLSRKAALIELDKDDKNKQPAAPSPKQ